MAEVEFRDVTRRYPGDVVALNGLNLTVADGEFLILVGPSGCGKSTALRLLAGLDKPTSGEIRIGGTVVNRPGSRRARHRDGVPELCALSAHVGVPQPGVRPAAAQDTTSRDRATGARNGRTAARSASCWTASPASSPAANVSGSPWAARWFASRRHSCSTNRCRIWMRNCATRCAATSSVCTASSRSPPSTSPTTRSRR